LVRWCRIREGGKGGVPPPAESGREGREGCRAQGEGQRRGREGEREGQREGEGEGGGGGRASL